MSEEGTGGRGGPVPRRGLHGGDGFKGHLSQLAVRLPLDASIIGAPDCRGYYPDDFGDAQEDEVEGQKDAGPEEWPALPGVVEACTNLCWCMAT